MHELAITQRIAEVALDHARKNHASRVVSLHLVIGELSSVVDDSVAFYWDLVTEGTLCEGARLDFERIPARLKCQKCHHEYTLVDRELSACPECGSIQVEVLAGKEFRLESLDIE